MPTKKQPAQVQPLVICLTTGTYKVDGIMRRFARGERFRADDPLCHAYPHMFALEGSTDAEMLEATTRYHREHERLAGRGGWEKAKDWLTAGLERAGLTPQEKKKGEPARTTMYYPNGSPEDVSKGVEVWNEYTDPKTSSGIRPRED